MDQEDRLTILEKRIEKIEKYLHYLAVGKEGIDPAYYDAEKYIKGKKSVTFNQLQKFLEIGYARVGKILELLEKNKKIGPKESEREKRIVLAKN